MTGLPVVLAVAAVGIVAGLIAEVVRGGVRQWAGATTGQVSHRVITDPSRRPMSPMTDPARGDMQ